MSADNYLLIRKEGSKWVAYMEFASNEEPSYSSEEFFTDSIEHAIILAQEIVTEYGYRFRGEDLYSRSSPHKETYFPRVCKHCGSTQGNSALMSYSTTSTSYKW